MIRNVTRKEYFLGHGSYYMIHMTQPAGYDLPMMRKVQSNNRMMIKLVP